MKLEDISDFVSDFYGVDIVTDTSRRYHRFKAFYYYLCCKYLPTYSLSLVADNLKQKHCSVHHQLNSFYNSYGIYKSYKTEVDTLEKAFIARFPEIVIPVDEIDSLDLLRAKRELKRKSEQIKNYQVQINELQKKLNKYKNVESY